MRTITVAVVWASAPGTGTIEVLHGTLHGLRICDSAGQVGRGGRFRIPGRAAARLEITLGAVRAEPGADQTLVSIRTAAHGFSFFVRDVSAGTPIWIPDYGVAVLPADDRRSCEEVRESIGRRGLRSELQQWEAQDEESYETACARNRSLMCPTWLGLSRDMRIFRVGYSPEMGYWGFVDPCYHCSGQAVPETENRPMSLGFCLGPGASCRVQITRRLEEGVLPILRAEQNEDDVTYHLTAFATLETQPIRDTGLRGSDWRAVYPNSAGHMMAKEDIDRLAPLIEAEKHGRTEETVCCLRVEAVNTGRVPRYAWFKGLRCHAAKKGDYDGARGFAVMGDTGRVYGIHRLNGVPMPQEEVAVLLPPGGTAVVEMLIPHQPLAPGRAQRLARMDVSEHLEACRRFWRGKLARGARIRVPEAAIDERIQAGLLHCDVVAYGKEPSGAVMATIGVYSPIGSESSPIIQFFDSMGWHSLAERSLEFFLERQRADGFIQNFGGYQLETGPALWSMGEHYRYTRDDGWVRRIRPKLLKACEFLLAWRARNKRPELRGRGYGLLDGKVADPEDFFHSFMLNGLSYVGIQRVGEMLARVDPANARRLAREAAAFRRDIRVAFAEAVARSPVIPLGDGTWIPSVPPWTEYRGPVALYADGGNWFTHGAFGARDSLIGALYLVISEVLDPRELATTFLLRSHQDLFTVQNAGLSQPYYCRHDFIHLKRGEVKPFLKTYYNQFTALQDRQTYTFWEHYFHASQHKTHEEGWFLMQTRWMLYLEEGRTLTFLRAIPRRWLSDGKQIELHGVATYFGPASLDVTSDLSRGVVRAVVSCPGARKPGAVTVRLPHPEGRLPVRVEGGTYDAASETVRVGRFSGRANIALYFDR